MTLRDSIIIIIMKVIIIIIKFKAYFTGEITLHVAQIVYTKQLEHYIPKKHGLFHVYNCT